MRAGRLGAIVAALAAGSFSAAAAHTATPDPDPGKATVKISASKANIVTEAFDFHSAMGIYMTDPQVMSVAISNSSKSRMFRIAMHGKPVIGKTYVLSRDPEVGPATIGYDEKRIVGGPELEQMRVIAKGWISTAGTLKVTNYSAKELDVEARGITMTAGGEKDNNASGTFQLDLNCTVFMIEEF